MYSGARGERRPRFDDSNKNRRWYRRDHRRHNMARALGLARLVASSRRGSLAAAASYATSAPPSPPPAPGRRASGSSDDASTIPPLACEWIEPPGDQSTTGAATTDAPVALVLHGLMGSGRNWRTFARALSARLAAGGTPWRFALVDHVWHGRTFGDRTHREWRNPAPATAVANGACAVDLAASAVGDFAAHVRAVNPRCRVAAVIGHSLGGKIALRHLARLGDANALPSHPTQWWSLDSVPSAVAHPDDDPHGVQRVIDAVRNHLPRTFAAREELGAALAAMPNASFPRDLVDWLGTNLAPVDPTAPTTSPLTWQFDPDGAAALYDAYKRDDGALRVALDPPTGGGRGRDGSSSYQPGQVVHEVHVVRAERSTRWPKATEAALVARAKERGSRLRYHEVKNAGHWLHVDNPGGLRDVLAPEMARLCASLTS